MKSMFPSLGCSHSILTTGIRRQALLRYVGENLAKSLDALISSLS